MAFHRGQRHCEPGTAPPRDEHTIAVCRIESRCGKSWVAVGFVDLHSHVLPALDDGSPDLSTSLVMIQGLAGLGFERICATPHQKARFRPTAAEIEVARAALAAALEDRGLDVTLSIGAENMWDEVLHGRLEADQVPSYDGGPAFLVELAVTDPAPGLEERLFAVRLAGRLPVLAHPERYQPLWADRDRLVRLGAEMALVVDLGAVAGFHGRREAKTARWLIREGIAHAAASDAHVPGDVRVAAAGIAWIRKKMGEAAVRRLLDENPRRILAGEHPE
jgi:protein-tyrosine phosphatase